MKPRVFLHIGHPKTGSSAFQTCLARSHQALAKEGILYPYHRSFSVASKNHISSGNLSIGAEDQNWMTTGIKPVLQANTDYHTFIFSNENLIHRLSDFTTSLPAMRDHWEFHVLLVVRDPIEQLGSVYQQLVKRHGYTKGYEEFLTEYSYRCNATNKAASTLQILDEMDVDYSLFNYTALKNQVIDALVHTIGIRRGVVNCSLPTPVNRSMSTDELQLLLFVNAMYGSAVGRKLADALVNQLPNVAAVSLAMRQESWHEVVRVNQPSVDAINKRLPVDNQLTFSTKPGFTGDLHCSLSHDQLQLSRQILATSIKDVNMAHARDSSESETHSLNTAWRQQINRLIALTGRLLHDKYTIETTRSKPHKKRDRN
jgi:hypothetical protein